jgi:hypothetical protein
MMLSTDEIRRRLRVVRFSCQETRNKRQAPSINGIAASAGVTRRFLYQIIEGQRFSTTSEAGRRVAQALKSVNL